MIAGRFNFARRLRRDQRGVSFMEFALILPILVTLGFYGTELAWMAMISMQVGQIATSVADNASRIGQTDNSAVTPNVKESQINTVLSGGMYQGSYFNFVANGRIILSSLERDSSTGRQYIHWQRCQGNLKVKSQYGVEGAGKTGAVLTGMGNPTITANTNSAVMYVEVNYTYQPLFGSWMVGNPNFRRESAFIIRDSRDLSGNTVDATVSSCT